MPVFQQCSESNSKRKVGSRCAALMLSLKNLVVGLLVIWLLRNWVRQSGDLPLVCQCSAGIEAGGCGGKALPHQGKA